MSDISRSGNNPIIERNIDLKIKHYKILLNEKINQVAQLEARLLQLKTVEFKRVELAIEISKRETFDIREEIKKMEDKNTINGTIIE